MSATIRLLRLCVAAALAVSFLASFAHAQKWSKAAPFPEASEELYGVAANGKFYVFGGLAPGWKPKALVYEYDPGSSRWTKKKNMPLASHHVALAELNGKIYVMGGFKYPDTGKPAWQPIDNAWEYDPEADNWKALAPLPTRRGSPNAVAVGGKIYVIGGRIGAAFITRASNIGIVEEYDPATDQWGALKASMPTPRSAGAWGTYNGRIYVAGGEERSGGPWQRTFRAVEAFDPRSNKWSSLPDMTFPRHGLAGDIVNGRFHLVSGDAASGGAPGTHIDTDVHEVLDIEGK